MDRRSRDITLAAAATFDDAAVAGLLTEGFSGYVVPIHFTATTVTSMIARDDIDLVLSLVALRAGVPVGVALVASRARRPRRKGDTGLTPTGTTRTLLAALAVVPAARGKGIGRLLLDEVVAASRRRGAVETTLQVFASNDAARLLYESAGFTVSRSLYGFILERGALPAAAATTPVRMRSTSATAALRLFDLCVAPDDPIAAPVWQAEPSSLARFGPPATTYIMTIEGQNAPVGVATLGTIAEETRLLSLGVIPAARGRGLGGAALQALFAAHPQIKRLSVAPIVPASSTLVPFFLANGATRDLLEQREMVLTHAAVVEGA